MKRFLLTMLCLVFALSLVACGSKSEATTGNKETEATVVKENVETTTKQEAIEKTEQQTIIEEKKDEGVDFSNAERVYVCAITVSARSNMADLAKEFGVKEYKVGDKIDLKVYDSFNGMKDFVKSTLANSWNGYNEAVEDFVVTNKIGDGYFKLECDTNKLYILYVAA